MKTNEFLDAMENIDPALIERADKKIVRKRPLVKIAAIAAAITLLVGGVIAVLPSMLKGEQIIQEVVVWENIFMMFSPKNEDGLISGENHGGEIIVTESVFAEIISENYADYIIGSIIPTAEQAYIGEKLGEIEIRTGWYQHSDGAEFDVMTVKAEVYEIVGVSRKSAVAIRYLEKAASLSEYYPYLYYYATNQNYEMTTLSNFYTDLNADTYLTLSKDAMLLEVPKEASGNIRIDKYSFNTDGSDEFRELLLSLDGEGEIVGYYDEAGVSVKKGERALQLVFHLETASTSMGHIYIFENGTIAIAEAEFGGVVAIFEVGVDATDALWEAFEKNAHSEKGEYAEDDLVEASTDVAE